MRKILLSTVLLFIFSLAFAGGYRVALQGQRALGMAHAGLSVFDNSEVAFFNPAGIGFLDDKFSISFGMNGILSTVKFQNELYNWTAQTNNPVGMPFYLYMTYKSEDNVIFGLAVYTPFGSSSVWNNWEGSQIVNDISMKVFYVQPSIGYKFSDMFSVSASFILAYGDISYNKNVNRYFVDEEGNGTSVQLNSGTVGAAGYGLSLAFKPTDNFSLGVNYRSSITLDARYGKAEFNNVPSYLQGRLKTTAFSSKLPMPAELGVGFSIKPLDRLLLAFDYNYTFWNIYKELRIEFKNDLETSISEKKYKNTYTLRVGADYRLTDKFSVRVGYYYDKSPLQRGYFSPETPSLDSNNYTFGLGYVFNKFSVDLSLLYVQGKERTDYTYIKSGDNQYKFGGTYVSNAIIPGLGITYKIK